MDARTFLDNFGTIAEAPGGTQRLRELILNLAVRGRLAEQDLSDQPTEATWSCDALRLIESKLWKAANQAQPTPPNWTELPMARLGTWGSGGTPSRSQSAYYDGDIPWLVIGDLNDAVVTTAASTITELGLAASSATLIPVGTVLIAMYGSIGKAGIAGIRCTTNQAIAHCIPDEALITSDYLFLLVLSLRPALTKLGKGGAQQNINQTIIRHLLVTVPPLAEQRRIVKKVDELMALCDELEHSLRQRRDVEERFAMAATRLAEEVPA